MRNFSIFIFICLLPFAFQAQVTVDQSYTIEQYVNDILLGSGVVASNITYTGDPLQIGVLENGDGTIFPMSSGLILSSDNAVNMDINNTDFNFITGVFTGDQDLLDIANDVPPLIGQGFTVSSINDLCVLEFDFIATGDSVKFNYSFGSDEYLTWVNSTFNDIFAFFLSGPGISGPYDSPAGFPDGAVNIAQVPGSDPPLPITISSVNNVLNEEFYIDNPFPNIDVGVNGFTVLMEASHPVECGGTYHIKLAIADGSDSALESVVVLETGSFTSNSVVQVDLTIDVGGVGSNTLYEDCGIATITFTRPIETLLEVEEMVFIEYFGDAIEGTDYNFLPDSIVFPPFVESVSFTIDAFEDGEVEGLELVQFQILNLAACNGIGLTSYFEFYIQDTPEPLVVEGYDITMCLGDTLELEPIITGGYGNFIYDWSTGETTASIGVFPDVSSSYNVIVADTCGMPSDDGDINVEILVFDPLSAIINGGDITLNCGEFIDATSTAFGGDGNYVNWTWEDQDGNNLFGFGNSLFLFNVAGVTSITATVTDGCGFEASFTVDVILNVPELFVESPEVFAACDEEVNVCVTASGGQPGYFYTWSVNGVFDFNQFGNCFQGEVLQGDVVIVIVQDNCGQVVEEIIEFEFPDTNIDIVMPDAIEGTCVDEIIIDPLVTGGTGNYFYQWSENGFNLGGGTPLVFTPEVSMTVLLIVEDECGVEQTATTEIIIINPAAMVDLPTEIYVSCIDTTLIAPIALEGIPVIEYSWVIDEEEVGTDTSIVWQTYVDELVQLTIVDACGSIASDEVMLLINDPELILNTSPDQLICPDEVADIFAIAEGGVGPYTYAWHSLSSSDSFQTVSPDSNTEYGVAVTDVCGVITIAYTNVNIEPLAINYYMNEVAENEYQFGSVVFPECNGGCQFLWDFGDGETSVQENPFHAYTGLETFEGSLLVTNALGCQATIDFLVEPPALMYIPGAFSPNGDGINDTFRVYGTSIESFEITIFNRWGQIVYASTDIDEVWIGEVTDRDYYAENETYNYVVIMKGYDTDRITKSGTLTILR